VSTKQDGHTYPESSVTLSCPTLCYPQHTQRSIVLSTSTDTESETLAITADVNVVDLFIVTGMVNM